ncbi:ABC-type transport system ATP-binding protein (probable substrate branched-chain amino acids) (plasmid) [Natronomonas pharaonis DSM 2160]|uniref:ABC-type transport system ATP-binding protein (Probable substrate branched-chain amino acids) n=1 Tax=Natronomonas pharaonis (strain ATCC 35678 / DSM 2160 / CIP 103997 / JCM 8858 / NBRC 14720 / NCIMB 2260 / Gabara) TaxID=348780 RepID=Q3ILZ0_NATPD|nr:ABC transporter ATP-binding protein [Natronomonas pharaonis]CAI50879.1 ABC-type transport system ATP-binding protein (probable substrate branched-chain amino acids) [Natronomonas pharaonis DSM 2160]
MSSKAELDTGDETATLVAEDIVTGYDGHEVLHGVSIQSHPGVTCIFGPNGSGKSTLLKSLNGVVPLWSGSVQYGDTDLTELGPDKIVGHGVATLPQGGGVFGTMTVEENLKLGAFSVSDKQKTKERKEDVLDAFPALEAKLDTKAKNLSGGQQMMVSLGRAMMTGADTYLMDEPSAGLAPALVDDAFDLIETLVDRGARVILIEQNVVAALRLADYIYILAEGELQFEGTPSELGAEEDLMELYLGIE